MNWFRNCSTLKKLMIGFSILSALSAGVGYIGSRSMNAIHGTLTGMYDNNLLAIVYLSGVNTRALYLNRALYKAGVETDRGSLEALERQMRAFDAEMKGNLAKYRATKLVEDEQAILSKFDPAWAVYEELSARTMQLTRNGNTREAVTLLKTDTLQAFQTARDYLNQLIDINQREAAKAHEQSAQLYRSSQNFMLAVNVLTVLAGLGLGWIIARMVSHPLRDAVKVLQAVADGDLTRSLETKTRDEVGQMSDALNRAVKSMRDALNDVRDSADGVSSASQQLAAASEEISSGAQEQASQLEETTASLEQIASSVRRNADSAGQANQLAAGARTAAENGGQVVGSAVAAMGEINASSKKIADIITTIDEIAFQTNLLALNAAVEAARAGEQGRGFAVVATEVRNLAQRSATAAKEIKGLIQDSVRKVETGSQMVDQSGASLAEIISAVKRLTDIVGEISAASEEQATGAGQVGKAMVQMDQVVQGNAAQTEELSSTAQTLSAGAEELQSLVARFRLGNGHEAPGSFRANSAKRPRPAAGSRSKAPARLSNKAASAREPVPGFAEF